MSASPNPASRSAAAAGEPECGHAASMEKTSKGRANFIGLHLKEGTRRADYTRAKEAAVCRFQSPKNSALTRFERWHIFPPRLSERPVKQEVLPPQRQARSNRTAGG
jgi:hypothetical protein